MRIGVDARNLVPKLSGIGRYVLETSRHLSQIGHEVYLYLPEPPDDQDALPQAESVDISGFKGALSRIVWGNSHLPLKAMNDKIDVLWGPAHRLPIMPVSGIPQVVTIHDLVWQHASSTMRLQGWLAERAFMKPSIKRAERIVAVSYATKQALSELYPWSKNKIDVVYPGCTPLNPDHSSADLKRFDLDRPYVLFVGTLEPRKNLLRLLESFAALPADTKSKLLLVIAGGQGWGLSDLTTEVSRLNITSSVRLTGFVSDEELGKLYRDARFLAMPSLYEGFGFPIVEANQLGVPVLTSNTSSMPEVGGDAALLVDPTSVSSISDGLRKLATDIVLHDRLAKAAQANAARFNWIRSASELANVLQRALNEYYK
ncbi:glycosyltransferase family 4 protein [Brucella anthropi]|uniref:glycosyltransferase family 4 protein n=1 Tax=Brucella anthropi TaxID=529 RepID=UPI00039F6E04|nr:glycosyltransferase family 1 protein [Brucella anthropi]